MLKNSINLQRQNEVQFYIFNSHGEAITAILEVVAKNQNNGNVEKAFQSLEEAKLAYRAFVNDALFPHQEAVR